MFGRKGAMLVRELAMCDEDQFRRFNVSLKPTLLPSLRPVEAFEHDRRLASPFLSSVFLSSFSLQISGLAARAQSILYQFLSHDQELSFS